MMIDREEWMRHNRFKNIARLFLQKVDQPDLSPDERQHIASECVYTIVMHTLQTAWPSYQKEMQRRLEFGDEVFIDIPDFPHLPDPSQE